MKTANLPIDDACYYDVFGYLFVDNMFINASLSRFLWIFHKKCR